MQTIPPLKQKTGIIKSKVPPPVPPRGSPRVDRRTSAGSYKSAGPSPRGATPSSGEQNYLNDKYFNQIQPNPNNVCRLSPQKFRTNNDRESVSPSLSARTPIFRNRSPTCVRDWLEINDFAASDYDEQVLQFKITEPPTCATITPRKPLPIRMGHLQRQSSFRSFSHGVDTSVRHKIEKYVEQNELVANQKLNSGPTADNNTDTGQISANIVSDRIKAYDHNQNAISNVDQSNSGSNGTATDQTDIGSTIKKGNIYKLRKTFENDTSLVLSAPPVSLQLHPPTPPLSSQTMWLPAIKPRTKFNTKPPRDSSRAAILNDIKPVLSTLTENVLSTLKRKQPVRADQHVIDENDNNIKRNELLKTHSKIQSVENMQYLDTFSLDGEFV